MPSEAELQAREMIHRSYETIAAYVGLATVVPSVIGHTAVKVIENFASPDYMPLLQNTDAGYLLPLAVGMFAVGVSRYHRWRADVAHSKIIQLGADTQ